MLRWTLALSYVLGIYVTLPYVRSWLNALREQNLLRVTLLNVCLLCGCGIFFYLRRKIKLSKSKAFLITGGLGIIYFCLYLYVYPPEEFVHFVEYAWVPVLFYWAAMPSIGSRLSHTKAHVLVLSLSLLAAALDEVIQHYLPNRYFDWHDIAYNCVGVGLGYGTLVWVQKVSKRNSA